MKAYLSILLHAHLPFVRHPEHERFLEESWLFEAVAECYLPLLEVLKGWQRDGIAARITLTLSPTLCAMLRDPLLQDRCERHLNSLVTLAEKEINRTQWEKHFHSLAWMYHNRFTIARDAYLSINRDLVAEFRKLQDDGQIDIITTAATHALLPMLAGHLPAVHGQILTARDDYRDCFGRDPVGIWLPECAYVPGLETPIKKANLRWFVVDTHGLLHARPQARYGVFAPVFTNEGVAAFGRERASSRQVWSRAEGYPGDPRYRDFYRDLGFDLDFNYVAPHLPSPEHRGFTGMKYYRISGRAMEKEVYERQSALSATVEHAEQFLNARLAQAQQLHGVLDRPPMFLCPYDAELFGHWWYEGPEFLDQLARQATEKKLELELVTPTDYLRQHPTNQIAAPGASSWGEEGYWRVWLNEQTEWMHRHLQAAQVRMTGLAARFTGAGLNQRALKQAARELMLAQASDWPFILKTGASPTYAAQRVQEHVLRFNTLHDQLLSDRVEEKQLEQLESSDNIFPGVNPAYWRP